MTTKRIVVPYFPNELKYCTPVSFGLGFYLVLTDHPVWAVLATLISVIVLTTEYVTTIDLKKKTLDDYLSLLWIPLQQDSKAFNRVDRIVISKGNHAQTINTRVQSRQMDWSDYTGTLIFDNDTLDLLTKNSKKELLKGLKEFVDFLKVDVEDRTSSEYYLIDMSKY